MSLVGAAEGIELYHTFRGQVQKLAALYAYTDEMTAPQAAKKAVEDIIGFKYDFRDGFRIPAKGHLHPAGVPSDKSRLARQSLCAISATGSATSIWRSARRSTPSGRPIRRRSLRPRPPTPSVTLAGPPMATRAVCGSSITA
jgi:hypothetical protein